MQRIRNRKDLEKWAESILGIDQSRWKATNQVLFARKILDKSNAIGPENIRAFRSRNIPENLLNGAALAYADLLPQLAIEDRDIFFKYHDIMAKLTGLAFEQVNYTCKLIPSSNVSNMCDADILVEYIHPVVSKEFGKATFQTESRCDVDKIDNLSVEVKTYGPGFGNKDCSSFTVDSICRKRIDSSKKVISESNYLEILHEIEIDSSASKESKIEIRRYLRDSFALLPKDREIENAGVKMLRPTKNLSLRLEFPAELFKDINQIPVSVIAWGPSSLRVNETKDYQRSSNLMLPNPCMPSGAGIWTWESTQPLIMGVGYALSYNTYETSKQIL